MPAIATIRETRKRIPPKIPLSVAIGDAHDDAAFYTERALSAVNAGADIVKVGLFDFAGGDQMASFLSKLKKNLPHTPIVAALYADLYDSAFIRAFPAIAKDAGIDGCLMDTYRKNGKKLTDFLDIKTLEVFTAACRERGLLSALAGSLTENDIELLSELRPDVIGFRGAVCKDSRGSIGLDAGKLGSIKEKIANVNRRNPQLTSI